MGSAFLFWVLASPPCDWVLKCLRTPRVDAGWQGPFVYYLAHRRRGDGELLTRRIGSARGGVCLMLLSLMQQQAENSWTFTLLFSCLLLCPGCYWNKLVKKKLGYWRLCALPVGLVWLLLSLAFSCSCGGWFDARGFCLFAVVLWPDTIMCCVLLGSGWLHTAANDSICSTELQRIRPGCWERKDKVDAGWCSAPAILYVFLEWCICQDPALHMSTG
jgi:hypothetical protein